MKLFKQTFAFVIIALTLVSCSDDDDKNKIIIPGPPVGVEVKYEVSSTVNMITKISYSLGDGDTSFGILNPDSPMLWDIILVSRYKDMPEGALLEAKCINNTDETQICTLNIYKSGVLIAVKNGLVPPADDDVNTDDTVTIRLTKIISE